MNPEYDLEKKTSDNSTENCRQDSFKLKYGNTFDSDPELLNLDKTKSYSEEFFVENNLLADLKKAYDVGLHLLKWDPKKHEISKFDVKFKMPDNTEKTISLFKEIVCKTW